MKRLLMCAVVLPLVFSEVHAAEAEAKAEAQSEALAQNHPPQQQPRQQPQQQQQQPDVDVDVNLGNEDRDDIRSQEPARTQPRGQMHDKRDMEKDYTRPTFGIGYNSMFRELFINFGVAQNFLVEIGTSAAYQPDIGGDDEFNGSVSASLLWGMHSWRNVTGYLNVTAILSDVTRNAALSPVSAIQDDDIEVSFIVAVEPEVMLWRHLAISTMFGVFIPTTPDVRFFTFGPSDDGRDMLANVKIKWMF